MSLTILQRTSTLSVATSTWTSMTWSSAVTDPPLAWSSGANVTTPTGAAWVDVLLYSAWASNSASRRMTRVILNSAVLEYHGHMGFDRSANHHPTRRYAVTAGDTLSVEVWQDTGGNLDFYDSASGMTPTVQFRWWT